MSSILTIQFPEDFEERYKKYKASIETGNSGSLTSSQMDEEPQTTFSLPNKYSGVKEPIEIGTLGIKINDNWVTKGGNRFKLNPTDRWLVYFLYYKFLKNSEECFGLDRLASEIASDWEEKAIGTIKNSISSINTHIKKLVTKGTASLSEDFIKLEDERGYHLNPKIFKITK